MSHRAAMALALCFAPAPLFGAESYRLGPQDVLRLKTFEYRAARDEIFEWKALSDEFTVNDHGALSLPLLGEIQAAGLTTDQLAASLGEQMRSRMGMAEAPAISVEITEYRPVFVSGKVEKPGAYPYKPGLTLMQAGSLAGGLQRLGDAGLVRLERDVIGAHGELDVLLRQVDALSARRARLQSELDDRAEPEFPPELSARRKEPVIALLLDQERTIFSARKIAFATQIETLQELHHFLEKEVDSLGSQIETENTQMKLINKELSGVSSLVDKGLAVQPRQLALERSIAQIEGEKLRIQSTLLRAKEDISRAEISMTELRSKRSNDIAVELRQTQGALDEVHTKIGTQQKLVFEAETLAPDQLAEYEQAGRSEPIYKIFRMKDGVIVEIPANDSATIEPGDTIKVDRPLRPRRQAQNLANGRADN
jgi:polysaccharide export outer membrane protein/exopolysaccharide production protein ExoF